MNNIKKKYDYLISTFKQMLDEAKDNWYNACCNSNEHSEDITVFRHNFNRVGELIEEMQDEIECIEEDDEIAVEDDEEKYSCPTCQFFSTDDNSEMFCCMEGLDGPQPVKIHEIRRDCNFWRKKLRS